MADPFYSDPLVTLYHADCLDAMAALDAESVDAIVTDPPYGLSFMGKHWDHGVPNVDFWTAMYRVAKPGAYLLSFAGTRTVHRFGVAIEDAGWEIRDELVWIYASGFPKSLDVSKAMDRAAGVDTGADERWRPEPHFITGAYKTASGNSEQIGQAKPGLRHVYEATEAGAAWKGWGTALKPAHEPIVMARKPLVGTVAGNVERFGTGALNIDECRIGYTSAADRAATDAAMDGPRSWKRVQQDGAAAILTGGNDNSIVTHPAGRWPSNVLLSDPALFDVPNPYVVGSGATTQSTPFEWSKDRQNNGDGNTFTMPFDKEAMEGGYGDSGGYSRFFIIPKADRAERERGMNGNGQRANVHPTVKPIDLMRHLVRLVTPPGGVVLDPFLGSGTTCLAASELGIRSIGIEREAEYLEIAKGRLMATKLGMGL